MLAQFVNQIEHHPENIYAQAEIMARMKRETMADMAGWFHTLRTFWRRFSVRQPEIDRSEGIQRGGLEQGWQETS